MRKVLLVLLMAALTFSSATAYAEDSFWADDSSPQGQIGLVWYEDVLRSGNGLSAVLGYNSANDGAICASIEDESCKRFRNISIELILPVCDGNKFESCVEGLSVGQEGEELHQGNFLRNIQGSTVPANEKFRTPYGSTIGIWQVPGANHTGGGDKYSVAARLRYVIDNGTFRLVDFQTSIVPFREVAGLEGQLMKYGVIVNGQNRDLVHDYHVGRCIWQEPSLCAVATRWAEKAVASVSLRVPNDVTGWLQGRLASPNIKVAKYSSQVNRISVTGNPVTVQGSAPKVDIDKVPETLLNVLTSGGLRPLVPGGGYVWQLEPAVHNFNWFQEWFPYTKDKAEGLSDYWNIKSIPGNFSDPVSKKCLSNREKLIGLVTTNSLWYSGNPPTFSDSELNYKVAALHFNPDGTTPFLGTYDLILDSTAARCLYGYSSAPVQAALSIISANGENQVATTTLSEREGWLKLSVKGFTFSAPVIKVKFTQVANSQASTSLSLAKKTTISCRKGTIIKRVSAIKPTCPKGYKKS